MSIDYDGARTAVVTWARGASSAAAARHRKTFKYDIICHSVRSYYFIAVPETVTHVVSQNT